MNRSPNEEHDKELFKSIAKKYSKKDVYAVSTAARIFQLTSLLQLCKKMKE